MKCKIRLITFLQFITLLMVGAIHILLSFTDENLDDFWHMYWIMPLAILVVMILVELVVVPLAEWWMGNCN